MPILIERKISNQENLAILKAENPLACLIPVSFFDLIRDERGKLVSVTGCQHLRRFSENVVFGWVMLEVSPTKSETLVFQQELGNAQGRQPVEKISGFLTVYEGTIEEPAQIFLRPIKHRKRGY